MRKKTNVVYIVGGHYTAVCKNPTDGQWYSFDDVHTKQITEAEVVTKVIL